MRNPQEELRLDNRLVDEELTARIGAALKETEGTRNFSELLACLNDARALFAKLMLHRRRILKNNPDSWKQLHTILLRIHRLEIKTLSAARMANRF